MDEQYVDQSSMVDDFLSQELVYQDSGESFNPAADNKNAESAEIIDDTEQTETTEEQTADTEQPEKTEQEAAGVDVEDPLGFTEKLPDGTERFNPISAMDFIARKTEEGKEPVPGFTFSEPAIEAPAPAAQQEQTVSYEDSLKSLYFAGFDYLESYIRQGYDPATAAQLAKQAADTDLRNHLQEKRMKDMEERLRTEFEEKKTAKQKSDELDALRPESTKNLYEMAKHGGYGSIEKFQQVLMTPGYGGDVINYLFTKDTAGQKFKSVDERAGAMKDWFIKMSADKQALGFLEEVARARYSNKMMPKLISEARKTREKVETSNAKAKGVAPVSVQNKQRNNPANAPKDLLSEFLGSGYDEV
jgi:hypothetical protein